MHVKKILVAAALACALAVVPVALAAGLKITTTPTHPKKGQTVKMTVTGFKPKEGVKVKEMIVTSGQTRTLFTRAGASGGLINAVRAQEKGKHVWTYTGRKSHRSGSTFYVVK